MTNDEKNALMHHLYKIAEHNGLQDVGAISFKKRSKLMDQLKEMNAEAWQFADNFFAAQIRRDRISSDKEKQLKNTQQWNNEIASAKIDADAAEAALQDYCSRQGIAI